ncbi:helix-turn-helix domain-containing protein [Streptomyces sp. NBC_01007]|nr:helix-turn-helix domain-containing protein [Streptomyces sp. NBC_01007]WRZ95757.1 helix-turn-helix domain-containing protein [Streptomyces sp. NBC_01007]
MIELSWAGLRVPAIAMELDCSQKTVRCWLHRFNRSGLQELDDLGGQGRKRRITEEERSRIIFLVKTVPPGGLGGSPSGSCGPSMSLGHPSGRWIPWLRQHGPKGRAARWQSVGARRMDLVGCPYRWRTGGRDAVR